MLNRREFVKGAAALAALPGQKMQAAGGNVSLILDPCDPVTAAPAVAWAAQHLQEVLAAAGVCVARPDSLAQASPADLCIVACGPDHPRANVAGAAESLALNPAQFENRRVLFATGRDERGLVYSLLELADRVQTSASPLAALALNKAVAESPANSVRSVTRLFTSDVEDKPWYNDREMWPKYLTMLASQRFNRFNLAFGIGYDFIRQVTDAYFLFAYPFLLTVPGYDVRATPLPDSERDHNLQMLKYISEQTVARGMEFQLGLWMHGYVWIDSPNPNYKIEGITKENHAAYCRDAVRLLLQKCPAISGITFRVHGESGVEEGSFDFWKTVFDGVATCGRKVRLDMHAKGMNQEMLDMAVAANQPVTLSPKFWAEHMGMTYHQADIREEERPKEHKAVSALMKFSAGSRSFLRYGYGDLLREDRPWAVVHRIWPGTQRLLIWGDPQTAAAYSRAFSFCGSEGVEICEPLSFKGRRGSGIAGDRCAYADASLRPHWDWEKYLYSYRVWGRNLYSPDSDPSSWQRYLEAEFNGGARHLETALASASRILPIVTTAHCPSAANNSYWPEMYFNQSLLDAEHPAPYTDTLAPKVFGNASALDPQLFSSMNDFAEEILSGQRSCKYSPLEVAQWIDDCSTAAADHLAQAEAKTSGKARPEYRRLTIDIALQSGLGRFFAAKFRAGVLYHIYEKTGSSAALEAAIEQYSKSRAAWAKLADRANGVYMTDVTVGEHPQLRGHWLDRLPAIDRDIAALQAKRSGTQGNQATPQVKLAIKEVLSRAVTRTALASHTSPAEFRRAQNLELSIRPEKAPLSVDLYYRHVDQAERFEKVAMRLTNQTFSAAIPASYTDTQFPLEYYFEIRESPSRAAVYPGLSAQLTQQPYFVVRRPKSS